MGLIYEIDWKWSKTGSFKMITRQNIITLGKKQMRKRKAAAD